MNQCHKLEGKSQEDKAFYIILDHFSELYGEIVTQKRQQKELTTKLDSKNEEIQKFKRELHYRDSLLKSMEHK